MRILDVSASSISRLFGPNERKRPRDLIGVEGIQRVKLALRLLGQAAPNAGVAPPAAHERTSRAQWPHKQTARTLSSGQPAQPPLLSDSGIYLIPSRKMRRARGPVTYRLLLAEDDAKAELLAGAARLFVERGRLHGYTRGRRGRRRQVGGSVMTDKTGTSSVWPRAVVVALCCLVCLWLAGCGAASGQGTVHAGDAQNGQTITLKPGQTLIVKLPTTYWTIQGSSNAQALVSTGAPVASPAPLNSCHYGGCTAQGGTTSETFRAVAPGTATVTASRTTCGEAMGCVGASGQYALTVEVVAATK